MATPIKETSLIEKDTVPPEQVEKREDRIGFLEASERVYKVDEIKNRTPRNVVPSNHIDFPF